MTNPNGHQSPSCAKDKTNPWVYYYSTAYRRPEDAEIYEQFVEQDKASTVVKSRKEDRRWAKGVQLQLKMSFPPSSKYGLGPENVGLIFPMK